MSAQPGWYDAGVPGQERWWDGTQWTAHERPVAPPQPAVQYPPVQQPAVQQPAAQYPPAQQVPAAQYAPAQQAPAAVAIPMGWYPVPGESDARWWDGSTWTPYRFRDGKPRPDAFAVEPPKTAVTMGIMFVLLGIMQFGTASLGNRGAFSGTGVLFMIAGALWLIGAWHGSSIRKKPAPQAAAIFPDAVRPLPGEAEGAGAGWYPVSGQVTRWWTGTRWSWYIGQKFGVRPGHAGPRGYLTSMILGWIMLGLGAIGLIAAIVVTAMAFGHWHLNALGIAGFVLGGILVLLGVLILWLTYARRYAMILPKQAPPLR